MDNPPDKPMKIMGKGIQIQTSIKSCPHCSAASGSPDYIDPVCMMRTTNKDAYIPHEYKGSTYYFCNPKCLDKFKKDPLTYINRLAGLSLSVAHSPVMMPDSATGRRRASLPAGRQHERGSSGLQHTGDGGPKRARGDPGGNPRMVRRRFVRLPHSQNPPDHRVGPTPPARS